MSPMVIATLVCLLAASEPGPQEQAEQDFTLRVLPLLKSKCFACHGEKPDDIKGELRLTSRDGMLEGGESGEPVIVVGKPDESPLIAAVRWETWEMPPKENDRLTSEQIEILRAWIAAGAPWPDEAAQTKHRDWASQAAETSEGILVRTSGGLSDEWTTRRYLPENLWAYRPVQADADGWLADARRRHPDANPIDLLIDRKLAELGLTSAPPADRRTLIRRATFDLLGLPPTPREVDEFLRDPAADDEAFARVIQRLLGSPHYGEQWGRHWLDVVRYADSSGYANDYERGNAWRYRDYVIRSFNNDKPYDQFVLEQIAGDEWKPDDPEMLVAVGFLRMGPWELTGMEVPKVARQRFLDDVTDAVGQTFLAHMLQCARCHDHKFDPVPTRDYYSLQAAFATTQLAERHAPFLDQENRSGFEERKYLNERAEYYEAILRQLDEKSLAAARKWYQENELDPARFEQVLADQRGGGKHVAFNEVRNALFKLGVSEEQVPPRHAGFTPQDYGLERVARKGLERLRWRRERYEPYALSVYSGRTPHLKSVYAPLRMPGPQAGDSRGELENTCVLVGGDPFSPAEPVEPGVLSAAESLAGLNSESQDLPDSMAGRRLALARWIASPENPLTARVMVNRIWQWHFGLALAGNPNNFGTTGKKPTHPALLDYLAAEFMRQGWSVKNLHRMIMMSEAYRRSGNHPAMDELASRDPLGNSYARFQPRRLAAEELRDATLQVTGELNPELGGIPIRPEMNLEAALQPRMVMGTFAEAWQPSPLPEQRHRRSIYALRLRGQRDPFLEVFNGPSPDLSCEARETSTVTPQVFALFNSRLSFDRALALAARLLHGRTATSGGERDAVLREAYHLVYQRAPSDEELRACRAHWQRMTERHRDLQLERPTYPREIVRQAVEENTGEKFTFVEPLEVYADFVPDLQAADAEPHLRGLAELCLVLLNSNEFAYVD